MGNRDCDCPDLWSHDNLPELLWYLDPDKVAHVYVSMVEQEQEIQSEFIDGIFDLFDPDKCPEKYLRYIAELVGVKLDRRDRVDTWRSQIRTAVAWYKEKGKINSFELLFRTMGITVNVVPLWINEQGEVDQEPQDSSWKPHARIDLEMNEYPEWQRYFPGNLQYVLNRMEEVRPIHVLIRAIRLGWEFFDSFPFDLISELDEDRVTGYLGDYWADQYFWYCGLWRSGKYAIRHDNTVPLRDWREFHDNVDVSNSGVQRNGGYYNWTDHVRTWQGDPPTTAAIGDRFIISSNAPSGAWTGMTKWSIVEYLGGTITDPASWVEFIPEDGWACWVHEDHPNPASWKWWYFDSSQPNDKWSKGGVLYENFRRTAPGPFFRECPGVLGSEHAKAGPVDEYEISISSGMSDQVQRCVYRDGEIQLRVDNSYYHDCYKWRDKLEYGPTEGISDNFPLPGDHLDIAGAELIIIELEDEVQFDNVWDSGTWDDPERNWDTTYYPYSDDLEINQIPS